MAFEEGKQEPGIDAGFSAGTPAAAPAASSSPAAAAVGVNRQVARQVKAASSKCRQLTADEALEIYRLRPSMKSPGKLRRGAMLHCKAVAPRFAVSAKTVREIWSGRSWTRVTRPEWTAAEVAARSGCWPEEHDGPETPIATPMPGLGSYGTLSTWHGLAAPGGNGMQQVTAQMLQQARSIVPGMPGAPAYDFQSGQPFAYWPGLADSMGSVSGAGGAQGGVPGMGGMPQGPQGMAQMGSYPAQMGYPGMLGGFPWQRPGGPGGQFGQLPIGGIAPGMVSDGSAVPQNGQGTGAAGGQASRSDMAGDARGPQAGGGGKPPPPPGASDDSARQLGPLGGQGGQGSGGYSQSF